MRIIARALAAACRVSQNLSKRFAIIYNCGEMHPPTVVLEAWLSEALRRIYHACGSVLEGSYRFTTPPSTDGMLVYKGEEIG